MLPWGITDNGDILYWLTKGDNPDAWTIAINESRGPLWEEFDMDMSTLLAKMVSGEVESKVFGDYLARWANVEEDEEEESQVERLAQVTPIFQSTVSQANRA